MSRAVWAVCRRCARVAPDALSLCGPLVVLAVIGMWLALVIAGWTLVYLSWLPQGFVVADDLSVPAQGGIDDALYLSLVTVATLGYGDIVPADAWLRIVAPLQALVGFAVVTAAVTWVLSIYPALSRARALAQTTDDWTSGLRAHDVDLSRLDGPMLAQVLHGFATSLANLRSDLVQFPATYYFHSLQPSLSLAEALPELRRLAAAAQSLPALEPRLAGAWVDHALCQVTRTISDQFLSVPADDPDAILQAYRAQRATPAPRGAAGAPPAP